ncbi:hypothetical protein [Citrobacter braakii]|uniref:hypothetical protein n=1 Tax=Citrobacter braakii TaxID=57706 RepID=UPI00403A29E9
MKYSGSGYNYTDTFSAKIEADGSFWTEVHDDSGADTGWVKGLYYNASYDGRPTAVVVTVSGMEAQEPGSQCSTYSHDESHCTDVTRSCMAPWKY